MGKTNKLSKPPKKEHAKERKDTRKQLRNIQLRYNCGTNYL